VEGSVIGWDADDGDGDGDGDGAVAGEGAGTGTGAMVVGAVWQPAISNALATHKTFARNDAVGTA